MRSSLSPAPPQSAFDVVLHTDTFVVLLDRDIGRSVTNDAENVIAWLNENLAGGLGRRRVFYRDTSQVRFDELLVAEGQFAGFKACSAGQQRWLSDQVAGIQG